MYSLLAITCVTDKCEALLFSKLQAQGFRLSVICDPSDPHIEEWRESGIRVVPLHLRHRFDLRAIKTINQLCRTFDFDLIFAMTSRGLSASMLASIPRTTPILTYRGTMGNLSYGSLASLRAHLNPRVDGIICVCSAVARYLSTMGIPSEKLFPVYKGHAPEWYPVRSSTLSRKELQIPEGVPLIGVVANVRPLKGIDVLFKAVKRLQQRSLPVHVVIVGTCDHKPLQNLPAELGIESQVSFLGFRKDAAEVMRLCTLTVMPSTRREGLARAVLESLFLEVPVAVSDTGGLPEIIEDRVSGYVTKAGDDEALAEALASHLSISSEEHSKMKASARARALELFTHQTYVESMMSVFQRLIERRTKVHDGWLSRIKSKLRKRARLVRHPVGLFIS